jgi:hypothetical protein
MSKEVNEPIACPHCDKPLARITMQRDDGGGLSTPDPRWYVLIAGRMNATALKGIAKLMKGWADG